MRGSIIFVKILCFVHDFSLPPSVNSCECCIKYLAPQIDGECLNREYLRGKYHCTIDLLFEWFGLVCFANKNKNCQLSYRWFQTSQTGGQWYSDTSPFSIPWFKYLMKLSMMLQSLFWSRQSSSKGATWSWGIFWFFAFSRLISSLSSAPLLSTEELWSLSMRMSGVPLWLMSSQARCQFHQHLMSSLFTWKYLRSSYVLTIWVCNF